MVTLNAQQLKSLLTTAVASGGIFHGAKIALIETESLITPMTELSSVQQAQYTGYAVSSSVTWGTPHIDQAENVAVLAAPQEFRPTGADQVSVVRQVALVNSAGNLILASYSLNEPLVFLGPDSVHMVGFPLILSTRAVSSSNIIP